MSRSEADGRYPISVFDRLLDDAPDRERDDAEPPRQRLRRIKESVRRDLETLLNTTVPMGRADEGRAEIETSVLRYGVSGFHGLDLATPERRGALARALRETIAEHEPRLAGVQVEVESDRAERRALRMRVKATLRAGDASEAIAFDTVLDPAVRQFQVRRLRDQEA